MRIHSLVATAAIILAAYSTAAHAQYLQVPQGAIVDNSVDPAMQRNQPMQPQVMQPQAIQQPMQTPGNFTMQASQRFETVTGGVTGEERSMIDTEQRGKPVKLVFAATNGEYLADVQVSIKDTKGEEVSNFKTDGPYVFIALPKGTYTVTAMLGSETRNQKITSTGAGQKAYTIRFSPQ